MVSGCGVGVGEGGDGGVRVGVEVGDEVMGALAVAGWVGCAVASVSPTAGCKAAQAMPISNPSAERPNGSLLRPLITDIASLAPWNRDRQGYAPHAGSDSTRHTWEKSYQRAPGFRLQVAV